MKTRKQTAKQLQVLAASYQCYKNGRERTVARVSRKVTVEGGQEVIERGGDDTQWKIKWEGDADADSFDSCVKRL